MATPNEKLAESLELLRKIQNNGQVMALQATELSRTHRERLVSNGFLKEATKGWYICSNPNELPGDSTSWYTSFWQFCGRFLEAKYGKDYCISAEQSIMFHAGNNTVPNQLIVRAKNASNTPIELLHDTSIFAMDSTLPKIAEIVQLNGIQGLTLPSALIHCSQSMFEKNATEIRAALAQISDASEILNLLLEGSHTVIAGRLAGAFRNIGQARLADDIVKTMKAADFNVREIDPFAGQVPIELSFRERSPYANRIKLMWHEMRQVVLEIFPAQPGLPKDIENYLKSVDEIYTTDAYHSLSIEQYTVTLALIELVRSGEWDAIENEAHRKHRDAMAAKGYHGAAMQVKNG